MTEPFIGDYGEAPPLLDLHFTLLDNGKLLIAIPEEHVRGKFAQVSAAVVKARHPRYEGNVQPILAAAQIDETTLMVSFNEAYRAADNTMTESPEGYPLLIYVIFGSLVSVSAVLGMSGPKLDDVHVLYQYVDEETKKRSVTRLPLGDIWEGYNSDGLPDHLTSLF